ncbi:MAG: regulatory protein RecX [bacterium]
MNNQGSGEVEKARAYAFLLLKFRLRSVEELRQRLKRKKFKDTIIQQTLNFLKEKAFIDDKEFARLWITSRIKKPLGFFRLEQELKIKGVDKDIIDEQLSKIRESYSESDVVLRIAEDRFQKLKDLEPYKAKRRLFQYLSRRGFSSDNIADALSQL